MKIQGEIKDMNANTNTYTIAKVLDIFKTMKRFTTDVMIESISQIAGE